MNTVIIPSAGKGIRSGLKTNKNLFFFDGSTIIEKTVSAFLGVKSIGEIIVTVRAEEISRFEKLLKKLSPIIFVTEGGSTRTESVKKALRLAKGEYVLIHDGARPFVTPKLIKKCLYKAEFEGNCIPCLPLTETVAKIKNGEITDAGRADLLSVQTPQVFKRKEILSAYEKITDTDEFFDDAGVFCKYVGICHYIIGEKTNVKLTYESDFKRLLPEKTGIGYDIHKLTEGRKLILGGVEIKHDKGLLGHSDADVVIHALMDSMLSALALKDIGNYFPDTDLKYEGISSVILLEKVLKIVKKQGYKPVSASISVLAEKPKLSPYANKIRENLARILKIDVSKIGFSCTTSEGVGLVGREEAVACYATCTLSPVIK